jgi:hypothetical protein
MNFLVAFVVWLAPFSHSLDNVSRSYLLQRLQRQGSTSRPNIITRIYLSVSNISSGKQSSVSIGQVDKRLQQHREEADATREEGDAFIVIKN